VESDAGRSSLSFTLLKCRHDGDADNDNDMTITALGLCFSIIHDFLFL